jgi:cytochrome P450
VPDLDLFIEETLRIYPPVPMLPRVAAAPDRIGADPIAAGDRLLVSVIGLHQDPAVWPDPRRFVPERHRGRPAHFAFGGGARLCGGQHFARIELALALIAILARCRLARPPAPAAPLAFEWGASMRRRGGHRLAVTPV